MAASSSSTSSSASSKKLILRSSDDEFFKVDEEVAFLSETIKNLKEDLGDNNEVIQIPNVDGKTLGKIIEFCNKHHADLPAANDFGDADPLAMKKWETDFLDIDMDTLFDLIRGACYMDINSLLLLTCKAVADKMKGKTSEEIRKTFNIKNDYTLEEEVEVRRENQWAFE